MTFNFQRSSITSFLDCYRVIPRENRSWFLFRRGKVRIWFCLRFYVLIIITIGVFYTADQLAKDYNDAVAKKQKLPWTRPGR